MSHRRTPRSIRTAAALAALALGVLGACSSDDDAAPDDAPTTTEEGTEAPTTESDDAVTTTSRVPLDPDDVEGAEQAYIDALIPQLQGSSGLEDDDAERAAACLAPRWVEAIGVDRFAEAGLAPEDLADLDGGLEVLAVDRPTAESMVDGFAACDVDLRAATLSQLLADPSITEEQAACAEAAISVEAVEESLVATLVGEPADTSLFAEAQACFTE